MVKAKPQQIQGVLKALSPNFAAVLLFGPDEGLVRERADLISKQIVDDLADPFDVVRLGADQIKAEPSLLSDERASLSMMGGRRLIRVDPATDLITASLEAALDGPESENLIVLTAGDLKPGSKLRKLVEKNDSALAIPCYADSDRDLSDLVNEVLRSSGLSAERDAVSWLVDHLGSDRRVSRSELDKLVLYMQSSESKQVTMADASAVVGDASAMAVSDIASAVVSGDVAKVDRLVDRAFLTGENPVPVLRTLARKLQQLHLARGMMDTGASPDAAMSKLRPPVFFKEQPAFRRQLGLWNSDRLAAAMVLVRDAEADCKTTGLPAEAITARTLLRIAATLRVSARG